MSPASPLGEALRRARTAKGLSIEDAERVTRIPRKYLEALELENFSILPAPVYARGFLRSYAQYLSLNPDDLLPFFPVGHVDEPILDPLPEVGEPRVWNLNSIVAVAVVGALILVVIALYTLGQDTGSGAFSDTGSNSNAAPLVPDAGGAGGDTNVAPVGPASALPDLVGLTSEEAIGHIEATGASYIIIGTREGDVPVGQVIAQDPGPGANVGAGDLVTITVAQ
jgi:transcriptional regulator with XRE-family HTH domain